MFLFKKESIKIYFPKRYIVTLLGFLGFFAIYTMRVNLSVAMVAMVNNPEAYAFNKSKVCACPNLTMQKKQSAVKRYKGELHNWDAKTKGTILGAFFYGYVITQIPGGYTAERFGAKWVFGLGVLSTALMNLVTPVISRSTTAFIALRVLEGLGEGVTFPAMSCMISKWIPKCERSTLSTLIYMGCSSGVVVSMPVSGWLCSNKRFGGWPASFYVFGVFGCVWFFFWSILVYESPQVHPSISDKELSLFTDDELNFEDPKTPWKAIFTSVPVWATALGYISNEFGYIVYLTELPSYLNSILHFNIQEDGLLSALPYIFQVIVSYVVSIAADSLRKNNIFGITTIRKITTSVGLLGPALCILGVTLSGCKTQLIVVLLTAAMALNGFVFSGCVITNIDMSPTFAGTIFGILNTMGNFFGFIGPALVGYLTSQGENTCNWNKVFYMTSGIYTVGALVFIIYGSSELQDWNKECKKSEPELPETETKVACETGKTLRNILIKNVFSISIIYD